MSTTDKTSDSIYSYVYQNLCSPAYEGASHEYRETRKQLLRGDPDTLAARELLLLQLRCADALRNNTFAAIAEDRFVTNLGSIQVNWMTSKRKKHEKMQDYWDEFTSNPSLDGYGNFNNIQSLWHHSLFRTGTAFTRLQIRGKSAGNSNKIPLKLQPIPSEYHDVLFMGENNSTRTRFGTTFDVDNKPTIYHFRRANLDTLYRGLVDDNPYNRINVNADEIINIFIRRNPGQWLGIPQLAPVLIALYELDELIDATVAKQKAAQVISWVIENSSPMNPVAIGDVLIRDKNAEEKKVVFKAKGTNVLYLNKGERASFHQSTDIGANLPELFKSELRRIAACSGIAYHQLNGDTSGLDFSSIRAIGVELRTRIEYILHYFTIPLGVLPVAMKFREFAYLYDRKLTTAIPTFQLPRYYGIDDLKDAQADALELQKGMTTLQRILDERHMTYEEIVEDAKRNDELKKYGIDLYGQSKSTAQSNNIEANPNSTGI